MDPLALYDLFDKHPDKFGWGIAVVFFLAILTALAVKGVDGFLAILKNLFGFAPPQAQPIPQPIPVQVTLQPVLIPTQPVPESLPPPIRTVTPAVCKSLSKLPTVSGELFGRDKELKRLDEAWDNPNTHLISVIAFGGVGKTALVGHWLQGMEKDGWRGARHVYGWSFYSQGSKEKETSAEEFLNSALSEFNVTSTEGLSAWDKGVKLAKAIQERRTLLILDGLEPMQDITPGHEGRIKDPGLQALVRELAHGCGGGLCVISSREELADAPKTTASPCVDVIELNTLSDEAGAQVLKNLGVVGTEDELRQASHDFGGHGLALNLLGTFLKKTCKGDVRKRGDIGGLMNWDAKQGGHARRVMASYEAHLSPAQKATLRLIGLFDRPAAMELVNVLRQTPAIAGFTDALTGLTEADWNEALSGLREDRLILETGDEELDAHPLVREHFGEALKTENEPAWKEAHNRIYEHLITSTKHRPDTFEEMQPLYQAIAHGCKAERHQEVFDDVFWDRIDRGDAAFSTKKLGAYGSDLAAIAHFFTTPWSQPVDSLSESDQSFLLNVAGLCLRALGRLGEAADPMTAGLGKSIKEKEWVNAAIDAGNLSELHLSLGNVDKAVEMGAEGVAHADRSEDEFWKIASRATHADALAQAGEAEQAQHLFEEAEKMQQERQPQYPYLYSLPGYRYCDLLLGLGQAEEVLKRAKATLVFAQRNNWLLDIALDTLSLGRAHMALEQWTEAGKSLNQAVEGLRKAGASHHIPRGLLARAEYYRRTKHYADSRRDLAEVFAIATRSGMRLHLTDAHLESARLDLTEGKKDDARQHIDQAARLIADTGYKRRQKELEALQAELA